MVSSFSVNLCCMEFCVAQINKPATQQTPKWQQRDKQWKIMSKHSSSSNRHKKHDDNDCNGNELAHNDDDYDNNEDRININFLWTEISVHNKEWQPTHRQGTFGSYVVAISQQRKFCIMKSNHNRQTDKTLRRSKSK